MMLVVLGWPASRSTGKGTAGWSEKVSAWSTIMRRAASGSLTSIVAGTGTGTVRRVLPAQCLLLLLRR